MKIYLLNNQSCGTLDKGRQENPDHAAKYLKQRKWPESIKRRRRKLSKGILQSSVIVTVTNRIISLIKAKKIHTESKTEFGLRLSLKEGTWTEHRL